MSSAAERAAVFAALGDPTRLDLLARLPAGQGASITRLAAAAPMSRQAVTRHLQVLEAAGLIAGRRAGRETLYAPRPQRLAEAQGWLAEVGAQWDGTLGRLRAHVEDG